MKNLLVTGGAGFIGSNFVHYMLGRYPDYRIIVFDKLTYAGRLENLRPAEGNPRFAFVRGDICDPAAVAGALRTYAIDTIVNFAAETHVDRSILSSEPFVTNNVVGVNTLLEAARAAGLERFHQISSVTGDTPLLVRRRETGETELRPIADLDSECLDDFDVLTMTDDYQVAMRPMKHFIKHPVDEVFEVAYTGGGQLRATANHSVFVFDSHGIATKPTSELRPGDLLVTFVGASSDCHQAHTFDLREILSDYRYAGFDDALVKRLTILGRAGIKHDISSTSPLVALKKEIASSTTLRLAESLADEGYLRRSSQGVYTLSISGLAEAAVWQAEQQWQLTKNKLHVPYDRLTVSPLLMEVFGLYLAEGHSSHTEVEISRHLRTVTFTIGVGEEPQLNLLKRCAQEVFGIHARITRRESTIQITYSSYWVHALFSQFGSTAETKRLPAWIWTQPKELIAAFLKGYEGDAAIKTDGRRCFTSVSPSLVQSLLWLARLGDVNCRISSRTVRQVAGQIPPGITVTRQRQFYDLAVTAENYRRGENTSWRAPMARCIPSSWVVSFLGSVGRSARLDKKQLVSKSRVLRLVETMSGIPDTLAAMLAGPIGVSKVTGVQRLSGNFMVYDVSVPGNEKFFGGNVPCLLHNTDEVYGAIPAPARSREGDPLEPRSPYSASKAGAEHLVYAYYVTYGLAVTTTRGSNNIGPYHYPEKAVPLFTTNALDNQPLPIYGDGRQQRDYQYVLDHCEAIDVVLHRGQPGEVYNVGTGVETYNIDMAHKILDILGKPESLITYVTDRAGHDRRYALDVSKLRGLGWAPGHTFDQALEKTVRWFVENEWWWRPIKTGEYLEYYRKQYVERGSQAA